MARSVADLILLNGDFAGGPGAGRRRTTGATQPATGDQAVCVQVGVRGVLDPDDRHQLRRLPVAASSPLARRQPDDRDPDVLSRARAQQRPLATASGSCAASLRLAVPAGVMVGTGVVAGYLFALHDLDLSVADSRTVALRHAGTEWPVPRARTRGRRLAHTVSACRRHVRGNGRPVRPRAGARSHKKLLCVDRALGRDGRDGGGCCSWIDGCACPLRLLAADRPGAIARVSRPDHHGPPCMRDHGAGHAPQ